MLKTLQMTKLEHMILHLKSITLRNKYTPKLLNLHHKNNLCLLNQKTQTTKRNLQIKNIVHIVTEQIFPSLLVSKKQRDDEEKRDAYSRSKSPQKSFV